MIGGGDVGATQANPNLTAGGSGGTVYAGGVPAGPQPGPSAYKLQAGSPMLGVGKDLRGAPWNQTITRDYSGNACPGSMGGTGFNIGADGCGNP